MSEAVLDIFPFLPFFLIMFLANLADKRRLEGNSESGLAAVGYILHGLIFGMIMAVGASLHLAGFLARVGADAGTGLFAALNLAGEAQYELAPLLRERGELIGASLWAPALAAPLFLLPRVRRSLASLIPIKPESAVHAVALSSVSLIIMYMAFPLAIGLDTLATSLAESEPADGGSMLLSHWAQQLTFALWALVGVGWLTRRTWGQLLARLAIVVPRPKEIAVGILAGLASVGVILLLETVAAAAGLGLDEDVERLSEALFGPLVSSIPGILTLGFAAGIGEETLFRGALQPRFGLAFTSLLFAMSHGQYGITLSTLAVLIVGLILGLLRERFNTTTCVITHATYNIILGLIAYLALGV